MSGAHKESETKQCTTHEKAKTVENSLRKTLELISKVQNRETLSDKEVKDLLRLLDDAGGLCGEITSEFNNVKTEFLKFIKAVKGQNLMDAINEVG